MFRTFDLEIGGGVDLAVEARLRPRWCDEDGIPLSGGNSRDAIGG